MTVFDLLYNYNLQRSWDIGDCWSENANSTLFDAIVGGSDTVEILAKFWYLQKLEGMGYNVAMTT